MKAVVAAWIGSNNLGDELIFKALLSQLDKIGISRKCVTAVSIDARRTTSTFSVNAVSHTDLLSLLSALKRADILIFGGGGLLQDETSIWNLPYHLSRIWLARVLGKPVIAIGLGAGRVKTRLGAWLIAATFGRRIPIIVRDEESKEVLEKIGLRLVTQAADLVFTLPPINYAPEGYVAVALRPFSHKGGVLPVGMKRKMGVPKDARQLAKVLDRVAEQTGLEIRFVSFDQDKDVAYQRAIAAHMQSSVSFVTPTVDSVAKVIGCANALIGMRYHAGIVAFLAGVPSVMIGYSPKVESLGKEAAEGCKVIAHDLQVLEAIPNLINDVLDYGDVVARARDRLRSRALENVSALRTMRLERS